MDRNEADAPVLQLRKFGDAVGVILPEELLRRLHLKEGDTLHLSEDAERSFSLRADDPKLSRALEIARNAFREYAETYRELAK